MTADERNKFRRVGKEPRKYYLAPDVIKLIERENERTGYPRGVIVEMLVRQHLGGGKAYVKAKAIPKPAAAKRATPDIELDI